MPETIPNRISDALLFFENASTAISAQPAAFGVTADEAANLATLLAAAQTAKITSEGAKATGESATVALATALELLEAAFRVMAQAMRANAVVTDETLATIGVFRRRDPAPIVAPDDPPIVSIERLNVGSATIWLQRVGGARGRPDKTIGAELSLVDGTEPVAEGEANTGQKRFTSRARVNIATDIGKPKIRLYARWLTARGHVSPWSLGLAFTPQT